MWLSRQSDSLVMNRSAVRIRPPAPQKPAQLSGFPCSLRADSNLSLTLSVACSTLLADQIRRFRYSVAQALLTNPPTSSTQPQGIICNTPQVLRGVCVCACGCVSAKEKCKMFACSAFFRSAQKLSAAHSFFFCGASGFPCSLWADSNLSLTQVYPTRKNKDFSRGDPDAACSTLKESGTG